MDKVINPFLILVGTLANNGRYMLARDLLDESNQAKFDALVWRREHPDFRDLDVVTIAAIMTTRHFEQINFGFRCLAWRSPV